MAYRVRLFFEAPEAEPQGEIRQFPSGKAKPYRYVLRHRRKSAASRLGVVDIKVQSHNLMRRNRNAFPITDTELKLIAAAASIGLNSNPKNG